MGKSKTQILLHFFASFKGKPLFGGKSAIVPQRVVVPYNKMNEFTIDGM